MLPTFVPTGAEMVDTSAAFVPVELHVIVPVLLTAPVASVIGLPVPVPRNSRFPGPLMPPVNCIRLLVLFVLVRRSVGELAPAIVTAPLNVNTPDAL